MGNKWEAHKDAIIQYYKIEGMTLNRVMAVMLRRYNFKAG